MGDIEDNVARLDVAMNSVVLSEGLRGIDEPSKKADTLGFGPRFIQPFGE